MTRAASLGMYELPWLIEATDALWAELRSSLRAANVAGVPDALDRSRPLAVLWRDPALLLGQTCGYPLVTELAGAVQIVATPVYAFRGCAGPMHRSFVLVRANDAAPSLAALRNRRCALNNRDSNTGMNLLRALVAPLTKAQPFFASVIETGSHLGSIEAVSTGRADVAAIDCVTYGLAERDRPALLRGLRVLTATAATPGLPFITSARTPPADLSALRSALGHAASGPAAAALGWSGIEILDDAAYGTVATLEREAATAGYPELA